MSSHKLITFLFLFLNMSVLNAADDQNKNGIDDSADDISIVWTHGMDVEQFWSDYADSKGGLTWGVTREYPDYSLLKEGDTILIELPQGKCLMEFFHSRWRRANDVWRWDDAMNDYGGCPYVFD